MTATATAVRRVGIVTFPGSLDDRDAAVAVRAAGGDPVRLWHADDDLGDVDAVILPGGFSWGDYLRCGAVAHRARIMGAVAAFAREGGPVLGICNGFQILCEAGLLPGALLRNAGLRFVSRPVTLRVERADTPWSRGWTAGQQVTVPLKSGEGCYFADPDTLGGLDREGRVVFRYAPGHNHNGSLDDVAGVCSEGGNVVGLMPHPEHAVDAVLAGGAEGLPMFAGLVAGGPTTTG